MSTPVSSTSSAAAFEAAVASNNSVNVQDYLDWCTAPLGQVVAGRLTGKVALVSGASSGIGAVTARRLAAEGAKVVLFARRADRLAALVKVIKDSGGEAAYFVGDAAKEADNKALVEFAVSTYGALHVTFNNAGISRGRGMKPWEIEGKDFEELMSTNVNAVFYAIKYQAPAIGRSGGGVILNNASVSALQSAPRIALYAASKSWVVWYSKHVASDLAKIGVRIISICPGFTLSDLTGGQEQGMKQQVALGVAYHPIGRVLKPEEIAGNVAYLSSDEAKGMTGVEIVIDGGLTVAPKV